MSLTGNAQGGYKLKGKLQGLKTIHGYSAYEVAVINGFSGTEEEWLESLKGAPGAPGKDGEKGEQGEPGSVVFEELTEEQKELLRGAPGKDGEDGQDGAPGKDGTDGKDGVSPTVTVAKISGGHRVTITDANGMKTFDVMDGEDGGGGSGGGGADGEDGVTFYPAVSADGVLSWTNDGGLDNPAPVNIKGADGKDGQDGAPGKDGAPGADGEKGEPGEPGSPGSPGAPGDNGATFTPNVDADGNLSWTNNGGLANPQTVNIRGGKGDPGKTPVKGTDYFTQADKTEMVNAVNTLMGAANTDYATVRARGIAIVADEAVSVPNGCLCAVYASS